jgi:secondary thiamine-phosphate synthase enzyme
MVFQREILINSKGLDSIYDITENIEKFIEESKVQKGLVNIFHPGSTASITTIEFEPGLQKDFPEFLNKIIPRNLNYKHKTTGGDDNGDAHIKSALIGPQITCPIKNGALSLGTWQQIILIDSDNKPRTRKVIVTVFGE